jgi:hypothetical protein
MAHFDQHFHTASGALVTSGMRSRLDVKIPVPLTMAAQNCLPAKQRRFSRPNNGQELRLKRRRRNEKLREKKRKESRCVKQRLLKGRIKDQVKIELQTTSRSVASQASQLKSRAEYYWRKWKEERSLRTTTSSV